jgi:hypothetical protein
MMAPRDIIARAWVITKNEQQIRRWGYASALLETLLNVKLFSYQVWFFISYMQGDPIGFFQVEEMIFQSVPFWAFLTFIIFLIILVIVELLFPHMAKGAIIGLAAKAQKKEEVKGGLVLAIYNFFPIFAIHEFFILSRIPATITVISLLLRYGGAMAPLGIAIVSTLFLASNILKFFLIFAEEAVVIRKHGIGDALKASFKLVISYLAHIVFLLLLFFVIVLRIAANALMIFLIPGIILGIGFALTFVLSHALSYAIGGLIGLVLIIFASYLFAYLEVFGQTVWTLTYMELCKLKELDIIDVD